MICPKCGQEAAGNYCSNCGALLKDGYGNDPFEAYDLENIHWNGQEDTEEPPDCGIQEEPSGYKESQTGDCIYNKEEKSDYRSRSSKAERQETQDSQEKSGGAGKLQEKSGESGKLQEKNGGFGKLQENASGSETMKERSSRNADKKADREEKKGSREKEARMKYLENEVEQLRNRRNDGRSLPQRTVGSASVEAEERERSKADGERHFRSPQRNTAPCPEPEYTIPDSKSRMPESRMSESRMSESRVPESRMPESRVSESRMPESRMPESRMPESRVPESRVPESRMPESRVSESRVPESRTPENRMPESRTPESRVPENRTPESRVSESRISESRIPESRLPERRDSDGGGLGKAAVKGMVTTVVITSRLMQMASFLLMACMAVIMAQSFREHGQRLGDIRLMAEEANYSMALYVGFAGVTLFMGAVWCLWILSRKGAGGGVRLKKYDTGRGLLPFLISLAAVVAAGVVLPFIPVEAGAWKGMAEGAAAAMEAVNTQRNILLFCGASGAVLSLVRKALRV